MKSVAREQRHVARNEHSATSRGLLPIKEIYSIDSQRASPTGGIAASEQDTLEGSVGFDGVGRTDADQDGW